MVLVTAESLLSYKKTKSFYSKMYKKGRKKCYNSLKLNKVKDDKMLWKTIKPFVSHKGTNINKVTLIVNDEVISDDKQPRKTFNIIAEEAVKVFVLVTIVTLGVSGSFDMSSYSHSDPVNNRLGNNKNNPSMKKISKTVTVTSTFYFSVDKVDVEKSIGNLNSSKEELFKNISTKSLKVTSHRSNLFLATIRNQELILEKKSRKN